MTRILLFGAGGVGGIYTYILDKSGAEVTAVCRSNFDEVSKNGFNISSEIFGEVTVKPNVVRSAGDAQGSFDYIVICSKVTVGISPSTSELIRPAMGPSTVIVLAQNGIGIESEYAEKFPHNTIISGVVYLPTTQERPGRITMGNLEWLEIGTYPASATHEAKAVAEAFANMFQQAGATCTVFDDIQLKRWNKLMVNVAWNPVCALTLLSDADYLQSSDDAEAFVRDVMNEVLLVAHAKGYTALSSADIDMQLERPKERIRRGVGKDPSMLTDVRMGRTMEIEAILGNLLKVAKEVNINITRCETIYALAKGLNFAIGKGQRIGPAP